MKLTRDRILELTDNGRMLFEAYLPDLCITGDKGDSNIASPFTNKPNSLSVFLWQKWLFKDYSLGGKYGDIFTFVALLHKLNVQADFVKIIAIIEAKMGEMGSLNDSRNDVTYVNKETNDKLVLADPNFSQPHIKKLFQIFHPLMDSNQGFSIRVVKQVTRQDSKKTVDYNFQWSKPKEVFFALCIEEGKYYVLYNTTTRETLEWGIKQENYVIGWRETLNIMFVANIYLRQTLVITNSITVMLNVHSVYCFYNGRKRVDRFLS